MFLPSDKYGLKPLWWFWLPWFVAIATFVANRLLGHDRAAILYVENGVLETLQYLIAFAAAGWGMACLCAARGRPWLMAWAGVAALASLYIGLEEISYGQHLLKWETPTSWAALNDQNETNFHNMSHWLDQKPRQLLMLGVVVGGMIIPLLRRYRPALLPEKFSLIYPSGALFWVSALAVLSRIAKDVHKEGIFAIYDRASEVNEVMLYYFVLLYLVMLLPQLRRGAKDS